MGIEVNPIIASTVSRQGSIAKTLTEGAATIFCSINLPTTGGLNAYFACLVHYSVIATDGTDFQCRTGVVPVSVVIKGSTMTLTVGTVTTATEVVAVSAGTLTLAITAVDAGSGVLQLKANATSSLTQTLLQFNYNIEVLYPSYPVGIFPA
jgi:hypothetical protein